MTPCAVSSVCVFESSDRAKIGLASPKSSSFTPCVDRNTFAAAIRGLCATPKGVRHGFGIKAVTSEVPLNMTQKWLGHARLATMAIYTDAVGPEEQKIAERMWV
jgi:integrase